MSYEKHNRERQNSYNSVKGQQARQLAMPIGNPSNSTTLDTNAPFQSITTSNGNKSGGERSAGIGTYSAIAIAKGRWEESSKRIQVGKRQSSSSLKTESLFQMHISRVYFGNKLRHHQSTHFWSESLAGANYMETSSPLCIQF